MLVAVTVLVIVFCDVCYTVAFPGEAALDPSARLFLTGRRALLELPGIGVFGVVPPVAVWVVVGLRSVERRRGSGPFAV